MQLPCHDGWQKIGDERSILHELCFIFVHTDVRPHDYGASHTMHLSLRAPRTRLRYHRRVFDPTGTVPMTEVQKALERALDAWKNLDRDAYAAVFAPEFLCVHPFGRNTTAEELKKHVDDTKKIWSHVDYRVEKVVGDDHHGAVHFVASLTRSGASAGIEVPITAMIDVEDGLITLWLETFDSMLMRRELRAPASSEA